MISLEKPIRRRIPHPARLGGELVVAFDRAGVSFKPPRARSTSTLAVAWRDVFQLAERLAGERAHREQLRDRALRRGGPR